MKKINLLVLLIISFNLKAASKFNIEIPLKNNLKDATLIIKRNKIKINPNISLLFKNNFNNQLFSCPYTVIGGQNEIEVWETECPDGSISYEIMLFTAYYELSLCDGEITFLGIEDAELFELGGC